MLWGIIYPTSGNSVTLKTSGRRGLNNHVLSPVFKNKTITVAGIELTQPHAASLLTTILCIRFCKKMIDSPSLKNPGNIEISTRRWQHYVLIMRSVQCMAVSVSVFIAVSRPWTRAQPRTRPRKRSWTQGQGDSHQPRSRTRPLTLPRPRPRTRERPWTESRTRARSHTRLRPLTRSVGHRHRLGQPHGCVHARTRKGPHTRPQTGTGTRRRERPRTRSRTRSWTPAQIRSRTRSWPRTRPRPRSTDGNLLVPRLAYNIRSLLTKTRCNHESMATPWI